jgi:hypothetical protein
MHPPRLDRTIADADTPFPAALMYVILRIRRTGFPAITLENRQGRTPGTPKRKHPKPLLAWGRPV